VGRRDWIDRVTPQLRRYARGVIGAGQDAAADDLVHQVLMQALAAAPDAYGHDPRVWLYSALIRQHRENVASALSASEMGEQGQARGGGGQQKSGFHMLAGRQNRLGTALAGMSLDEREALLLVVLEGFTYAQSAEILGIPRASVIARLTRARAMLDQMPGPKSFGGTIKGARPQAAHLRLVK
jgi:RNA polymerase sigma-70 factor, ECF subfamily